MMHGRDDLNFWYAVCIASTALRPIARTAPKNVLDRRLLRHILSKSLHTTLVPEILLSGDERVTACLSHHESEVEMNCDHPRMQCHLL